MQGKHLVKVLGPLAAVGGFLVVSFQLQSPVEPLDGGFAVLGFQGGAAVVQGCGKQFRLRGQQGLQALSGLLVQFPGAGKVLLREGRVSPVDHGCDLPVGITAPGGDVFGFGPGLQVQPVVERRFGGQTGLLPGGS